MAGSSKWARRTAAWVIGGVAGFAFLVSAACNYRYGLSQGTDELFLWSITTRQIKAYGYLAVDVAAAVLPIGVVLLFRARLLGQALIVGALAGFLAALAFFNTVGFMGMERDSAMAHRAKDAGGYQALADQKSRLERERGWVPQARPSDVVAAMLSEKERDALYTRSKRCEDITKTDSRTFCDGYRALQTELASAGTLARIDRDIATVQNQIKATRPVVASDALAGTANEFFGVEENRTNRYKPLFDATALFLLATFGFAIAEGVAASGAVQPLPATVPAIEVVQPPSLQLPTIPVIPDPCDPAPVEEIAPPPEKPKETATGQASDKAGQLPAKSTPEDWVARWAWQMHPGVYQFEALKEDYVRYAKLRKVKAIRLHQLGTVLVNLGYQKVRENAKSGTGKRVAFRFPNEQIVRKRG